jgi:uncharacterized protein (TIGR02453 family)
MPLSKTRSLRKPPAPSEATGASTLPAPRFPKEGLDFLRSLKRNNRRPWFLKHKDEYERFVKAPMIELVMALSHDLPSDFLADPAKSIFRIYRDVRFSKDKSPYKTHASAHFPPRGLPRGAGAGFYFHVAPTEVWIGGGFYAPTPQEALAVRTRIAERHRTFQSLVESPEFRKYFGEVQGAKLTRVPRGFPCDHPAAEWLKHKQWIAGAELKAEAATGPKFYETLVAHFQAALPLLRFLNTLD